MCQAECNICTEEELLYKRVQFENDLKEVMLTFALLSGQLLLYIICPKIF